MKNKVIENFAMKTSKEMAETVGLTQHIQKQIAIQSEVSWNALPVSGQIAVMPHTVTANHHSEYPLHSHDFFELVYIYRGCATQYLENGTLRLEEGSVCVMNTNYKHGLYIDSDDSIVFNVLISKPLLNTSFLNLMTDNDLFSNFFITALFSHSGKGEYIYFQKNPASRAEFLMQSLLEEYILHKPGYQAAMQSYLSLIFTELHRNHVYQSEQSEITNVDFSAIMSYVSNHLEDVTLNSLAAHFHYTPTHLSRLLKKYLGQSFSSLLNELRLNKAASYLKNTNISIDAIVELLGYYDRSYFNRVFKKHFGCSPHEYRYPEKA